MFHANRGRFALPLSGAGGLIAVFEVSIEWLMANLHCRNRIWTRTRIPNPMGTFYYAEMSHWFGF